MGIGNEAEPGFFEVDTITYQGDQPHCFPRLGDAEAVITATMTRPVL